MIGFCPGMGNLQDFHYQYNEIEKKLFIKKHTSLYSRTSFNKYAMIINTIDSFEKVYEKPLYEFSYKECEDVVIALECKFIESFRERVSSIIYYLKDIGVDKSYFNDIRTRFKDFVKEKHCKDWRGLESDFNFISYDEINNLLLELINKQDNAMILSIYEGICGQRMHELINMKVIDINEDNEILLKNISPNTMMNLTRKVKISDRLKQSIIEASNETKYKSYIDSPVEYSRDLIKSSYVFRSSIYSNTPTIKISFTTFKTRLDNIAKYFNDSRLNIYDIMLSGLIHRIKESNIEVTNTPEFYTQMLSTIRPHVRNVYWYSIQLAIEPYIINKK